MEEKIFDLIIIGCGPGGMSAGVYACRAGMSVLVLEKAGVGGQCAITYEVKNYPGFTDISGMDLSDKMLEQLKANGAQIEYEEAVKMEFEGDIKTIHTFHNVYKAKSVILALGAKPRKLGFENEKDFLGRGISYCAICDGAFFRDKTVIVAGGGNSAFEDALYLANLAKKVYLVHRREEFKAQDVLVDALTERTHGENANVEFILNSRLSGLFGDKKLEQVEIENLVDNSKKKLEVDGVFVAVGRLADTSFVPNEIKVDKFGYIVANEKMETNVKGVYAIGDCIQKSLRQIVTACADGAIASTNASIYVKSLRAKTLKKQ